MYSKASSSGLSSSSKPSGRKRAKLKSLTIYEKSKVLDRIDAGASMRMVCEEFKIKSSTFYDLKKLKDKLCAFAMQQDNPRTAFQGKMKMKTNKFVDLEEAVFEWYKHECAASIAMRGIDIQDAAQNFAQHLEIEGFQASSGWLFQFQNRHCLGNHKIVGEILSADMASVEPLREQLTNPILDSGLLLSQMYEYNGDETDLYWKSVPVNTQASKE